MSAQPAPTPAPRDTLAADCAEQLKARFPALFTGAPKPLKIKIQADIQERAPGVFSKQALSAFFRRYTGSTGYLIAITKSPHRFDLDGQPAGDITDEHRQVAETELARRRAKQRERREQEDAERRNRAQLLHDFERTTLTPHNFCALKGVPEAELDALLALARQERAEAPPRPAPGQRPHGRPPRPDARPGPRPDRRPHQGRPRDGKRQQDGNA